MVTSHTVSFVNILNVFTYLGFTDNEIQYILDSGFSNVSFGDAFATLVGNKFALQCITEAYNQYHTEVIENKSMTDEMLAEKFWTVVGSDDYINLEV